MTSVDYSIYYPCAPPPELRMAEKQGVGWVPPHHEAVIRGYKHFPYLGWLSYGVGLLGRLIRRVKVPVHDLAPVLAQAHGQRRPLVIFSHGLVGTRSTYSQYCSMLAAAGMIVLAIEHRDGSGPAVMLPSSDEKGRVEEEMLYVRLDDLTWPDGHEGSLKEMGETQLDMRVREIYEAYHHFCHLATYGIDSRTIKVGYENDDTGTPVPKFVESLKPQVDLESVYIAGHSFGGGTALQVVQTSPLDEDDIPPISIKGCIALDPRIELLADPAPSPRDATPRVPVLCINSPRFTDWKAHFERLGKMIEQSEGTLLTLSGTTHQSFSDFAMFLTLKPARARRFLQTIASLSMAFINDDFATHPQIVSLVPEKQAVLSRQAGAIALHLLAGQGGKEGSCKVEERTESRDVLVGSSVSAQPLQT